MNNIVAVLICMLFFNATSHGQEKIIYYDQDQVRTDKAHAKYFVTIAKDRDKYKMTALTINGHKTFFLGWCLTPDSESRDGFFTFYENGYKSSEGPYENNKRTGMWNNFFPESNTIWYTEQYRHDTLSEIRSFYENMQLKRDEVHMDNGVTGKCYDESGKEIPFTTFWWVPAPPYDLGKYIDDHIHYPEKAKEKRITGRVIVKFHIATDGSIKDISIVKHLGGGCDEEAKRIVATMPKWNPGTKDGTPTEMPYFLPLYFKLK